METISEIQPLDPRKRVIDLGIQPVRGWKLPGNGVPYTTCGTPQDIGCMNSGKHTTFIGANPQDRYAFGKRVVMRCKRPSCPICARQWMVQATKECTKRIKAGKPQQKKGFRTRNKAIHVTISPPPELYPKDSDQEMPNLRRLANRWLKEAGLEGYMLIYHPYRQNKEKKYINTPEYLKWRYSPHFHALGYGWINWGKIGYERSKPYKTNRTSEENKKAKGWIIKNHRIRKSIEATIYYQLSHAGVKELRKTISWGGTLSWRKLSKIKKLSIKFDCPICGDRLRPIKYTGKGSSPLEGSPEGELITINANDFKYTTFRQRIVSNKQQP